MTGDEETEKLLEQNLRLVHVPSCHKNQPTASFVLHCLSKAIIRLAQSIEDDKPPGHN
jgi:hypothetical protein